MRCAKQYLALLFVVFLFDYGLAKEPELTLEISLEGKIVSGDVLDGNIILSSPEAFQVMKSNGKEIFKAELGPNQHLVASEDGGFYGITTYSTKASPGFLAAERFELHSADGEKLWEIENPKVSEFLISPGGELVVGMSGGEGSPESALVFYDHAGELISSTAVRFPQGISFSADGKYVLVNSAKDGLLLFDDPGELKSKLGPCERFAISADGEYVAAVSNGSLRFYHQGKPIGEPQQVGPFVREMVFSPESEFLGLIDKKNLHLFKVKTGKLLLKHTLKQAELSFVSLDLSPGGERTVTGLDLDKGSKAPPTERHTNGLVLVFHKDGSLIWHEEISYKLWSALFPRVQLSADGSRFSVTTREKIHLYQGNWSEK